MSEYSTLHHRHTRTSTNKITTNTHTRICIYHCTTAPEPISHFSFTKRKIWKERALHQHRHSINVRVKRENKLIKHNKWQSRENKNCCKNDGDARRQLLSKLIDKSKQNLSINYTTFAYTRAIFPFCWCFACSALLRAWLSIRSDKKQSTHIPGNVVVLMNVKTVESGRQWW